MDNNEKPECQLLDQNGNVFNLIGITRKTLRKNDLFSELETFDAELADLQQGGGTYDDVLVLIQKFVDVV